MGEVIESAVNQQKYLLYTNRLLDSLNEEVIKRVRTGSQWLLDCVSLGNVSLYHFLSQVL